MRAINSVEFYGLPGPLTTFPREFPEDSEDCGDLAISSPDPIIVDTASRILREHGGNEVVAAAEAGTWPAPLWESLEESGLTLAWVPEAAGGPGAALADGFEITRVAGRHAAPVPLAETLLAGWVLAEAGMPIPSGPLTVAPVFSTDTIQLAEGGTLSGIARRVPYAPASAHAAVVAQSGDGIAVALVRTEDCALVGSTNMAGEPCADMNFDGVPLSGLADRATLSAAGLLGMGAAVRAHQIAGALQRSLEISLEYAQQREQFGRTISRFQAVQHNLAMLAGEVTASGAAAGTAARAIEAYGINDDRARLALAAAKIRAGEAAGAGAAIAHQVHGAMGFTQEYVLHQYTRRLWAWRDDFDSESQWASRLGRQVAAIGPDDLWPALTDI